MGWKVSNNKLYINLDEKRKKIKTGDSQKISEAMRGRKQTVSTRLKISEAMKKYWERIPYEENNNLENKEENVWNKIWCQHW